MTDLNKSYYAIIPANIRYDKEINSNAKLLYCEITALCNEKGYCCVNNEYFAELYAVSERTISRWINKLIQKGYIIVEFQYKTGTKKILKRYIMLASHTESVCEETAPIGGDKTVNRYRQNCQGGGDKTPLRDDKIVNTSKVDEINENIKLGGDKLSVRGDKNVSTTKVDEINENYNLYGIKTCRHETELDYIYNNNNIYNNNILSSSKNKAVDKPVHNFEEKSNKCAENNYLELISKIIEHLNKKCNTNYKVNNKKTKACIIARFNEDYKLEDFLKVIDIKSDEWLNDSEMSKYLRPETLFGNKFEGYLNQKVKPQVVKTESQKPANKFHNFDQKIASMGNEKLEEMARKRFEGKLKSLKGSDFD